MQAVLDPIIGPGKPDLGDLSGRSAIVTGGAEGIGEEVSLALALAHCRVVMINRKQEQGDEAIKRIKAEAEKKGIQDVQVEWRGCDLGDFKQVKEVFSKLAASEPRLDFVSSRRGPRRDLELIINVHSQLILSAGINTNQFGLAASGIDRHMSVNVSTF
jgi:NAD(P)-dependent dehydrogenase (short-subunit alcohol dehydrogenase family)